MATYESEETIELTRAESLRLRAIAIARCQELDVLSAVDIEPVEGAWDPDMPTVRAQPDPPTRTPPRGLSLLRSRRR